ncbi:MAG TPA: caspase family protein [Polyangia bacterium]
MTIATLPLVILMAARFAIVASAEKADGQPSLRFAERDGQRIADTLRELGNFNQVTRLHQPSLRLFEQALDEVEERATRDPNLEIFIYYSGHADETGLLLGSERLTYPALRKRLERSRAAVRVAFLDACHTGNLVQAKGGVPAPGFTIDTLPDTHVRGAAIFSASRSDELAQESGAIEGSFFTHHLLSALRGAGDRDGNGLVTLGEAYQYAYDRTLASTLPSLLGPQHPAYEYQLSGTGDLVLTRLSTNRQAISLPAGSGPPYVVTSAQGDVVAEVSPHAKRSLRVLLSPGRYRVATRDGSRARVAEIVIEARGPDVVVDAARFKDVPTELAFAKGLRPEPRHELLADLALTGLGPGILGLSPELGLGYLRRAGLFSLGPRLGYGSTEGVVEGVPYQLSRWKAMFFALRRFQFGVWQIEAGAGLGASFITESYGSPNHDRHGRAPAAALAVAIELPLVHWLALRLQWGAGMDFLWVGDHARLSPELSSTFALAYRL